ncbi:MAG: hypothetical protein WCH74_11095, partial [Chloroflexota bacterium]
MTTQTLIPPSRRLGWLLTVYGVVGVILAIAVLIGSIVLGYQVGKLNDQVAHQRQATIATLDSTILLIGTVTSAAGNIDTALTGASSTVDQAAGLAKSAADAARSVQGIADFEFFGQKPLAGIGTAFGDVAAQAEAVANQLGSVSSSMTGLGGNLTAAVPALTDIQAQAQLIKDQLNAAERIDDLPFLVGVSVIVVGLYLAWLGVTALGALWIGRRMLVMTKNGPGSAVVVPAPVVAPVPVVAAISSPESTPVAPELPVT